MRNEVREQMWHQRSRAKWLCDGDRNTRFYHVKTLSRRRNNRITALRDSSGVWRDEENIVRNMVNEFYKDLFTEDISFGPWFNSTFSFGPLTDEDKLYLMADPSTDEVKHAIFSMGPWKSPGPDGFPPGFFQKDWATVGASVCAFVDHIWKHPKDIASVNHTDICLIPKITKPEFISQFRPISLCNTIYKVVSKIIVYKSLSF